LTPAQRVRRLAKFQGCQSDSEQDEDDLSDGDRDVVADEYTAAQKLDQIEVAVLLQLLQTIEE
jgi:hypothetical protein